MQDTLKIGAAALGGYVLGRTKKAKTAIGLALWLSGHGRPRDIARNQAARLLKSDRAQDLLGQVRGPIVSAGKDAALSMFESRAGRLSENLQRRTEQIGDTLEDTGRRSARAARAGTGTAARLTERRRRSTEPDDEEAEDDLPDEAEDEAEDDLPEDDEALDEQEEPAEADDELGPADDEDEYDDEAEYADEDEYDDEAEYDADEAGDAEPVDEDDAGADRSAGRRSRRASA
jgi:hypothetical protein